MFKDHKVLMDNYLDILNNKFATVLHKGDYIVIDVSNGDRYTTSSFKSSLAEYVTSHGEKVADQWLEHCNRRHYPNGIVFDPSSPPGKLDKAPWPKAFNIFKGWQTAAIEGDTGPWDDFLDIVISNGDPVIRTYVEAWCAHILQKPAELPGTAIVIIGKQGSGKSTFTDFLMDLYGTENSYEVNDSGLIVGRFTQHLEAKMLVVVDEACIKDARGAAKLKNMITAPAISIEPKGLKAYMVNNFVRFIMTGNHPQMIRADDDERRYVVIHNSCKRVGDFTYFTELRRWWASGGKEAVMFKLMNLDISNVNLRSIPKTAGLAEQKLASLGPIGEWYLTMLQDGVLAGLSPWDDPILSQDLYDHFIITSGRSGKAISNTIFSRELRRYVSPSTIRPGTGNRQRMMRFPPLAECRSKFCEQIGHEIEWGDADGE